MRGPWGHTLGATAWGIDVIDLHCHILPGLDDGPTTDEEALEMCRIAWQDGIRQVVAMPHTLNGVYYNDGETILEAVEALNRMLRARALGLEILPGSDVRVDPDLRALLRDGRVMSINNTGKAVMLELPDYFPPGPMARFFDALLEEGIIPVVSHPERCAQFRDRGLLREMVELGALTQVTAMSLTGEFSREIQGVTRSFLEEGLVHVIASDAHSGHHRPPILSRAVTAASEVLGEEAARALVVDNPRAIIRGLRPGAPGQEESAGPGGDVASAVGSNGGRT